jgi:hypothetical protein
MSPRAAFAPRELVLDGLPTHYIEKSCLVLELLAAEVAGVF